MGRDNSRQGLHPGLLARQLLLPGRSLSGSLSLIGERLLRDARNDKFSGTAIMMLLVLAFLERLLLWVTYQSVVYSDTNSYRRLAESILNGWTTYDGTRTPGYPAFLAWIGSDQRVWLMQMVMGAAITIGLFCITWWLCRDTRMAFLAGVAHLLNLGQLFFEANLLTETPATFWIFLALGGVVYGMVTPARRTNWLAAGIGLAASIALLTRPLFVYLPPWMFFFIWLGWGNQLISTTPEVEEKKRIFRWLGWLLGRLRQSWHYLVAFSLPVLILVGGWVGFIHQRFGSWGLSTMTGYHLVQHTGVFFEYVPDEYAVLRDTYLKYRNEHIARTGTQANTIWEAIPEMQKVSDLGFYELSDVLAEISLQLIREHPGLFARNLLEGWRMFWYAPMYWSAQAFRWPTFVPILRLIILGERLVLIIFNLVFLITTALVALWSRARRAWRVNLPWVFLLATVWATSVVQTFLDHGDNPRFLVPLQSIVVIWVLWLVWLDPRCWFSQLVGRRKN